MNFFKINTDDSNFKTLGALKRTIQTKAPYMDQGGYKQSRRVSGHIESDREINCYEKVFLYIQKGLGCASDDLKKIIRMIYSVQNSEWDITFPLFLAAFGETGLTVAEKPFKNFSLKPHMMKAVEKLVGNNKLTSKIILDQLDLNIDRSAKIEANDLILIFTDSIDKLLFSFDVKNRLCKHRHAYVILIKDESVGINFYRMDLKEEAINMVFEKDLSDQLISELLGNPLFIDCIRPDCLKKDRYKSKIFPAVRNGNVCFYYRGGRAFQYDGEFKTHRKYLTLIKKFKDDYVSERMIQNPKIINNFYDQYKDIKDACKQYQGIESIGVSYLYSNYSFLNLDSDIVVLDVEISFKSVSDKEDEKMDRVDILLFSKNEQSLGFVEAKHFSNPELWSNTTPKCVLQIKRYNDQIKQRSKEILSQYSKYVQINNQLFGINLPEPSKIQPQCGLYVFGFDANQKKAKIDDTLENTMKNEGIKYYARGDYKNADANTIWKKLFGRT